MPRHVHRSNGPAACGPAIILVGCLAILAGAAEPVAGPGASPSNATLIDHNVEARVGALLGEMTLEEKLGQLNQFSYGQKTGPGTDRGEYGEMIARGQIGSILNATGPLRINELQRIAVERSRLKVPILFGLDVIHGYWTTFPIPLAMAATWNPDLVERAAAVAAREAASDGIRWTFSPMVDIARDARWGRIVEGAGEDPHLGAVFARAYVHGYQGRKLSDAGSIAACAKHYVGYGAAEAGRDYNSTEISDRTLREIYLPPFKAAIDAGAPTLMSGFNAINGVPASANGQALDGILRREWGFGGFVVSDWTSIKELIAHGVAIDGATAARKALMAGVDMDMEGLLYLNELPAEVEAGRVPIAVVDEAVRRVLRVKFALGLFERPFAPQRLTPGSLARADIELARSAAEQSFVLLKNGGPGQAAALPIAQGVKTIALIGPLADSAQDMLGAWSGRGNPGNVVTLRAAMARYAADNQIRLLYERGTEIEGGPETQIALAVAAARRADVVVLAVGESAGMTGEAASRTNIGLPGLQPRLLDAVAATGQPIILVVFSGRPLALAPYLDKAVAVVQAWHPGIQGGPALVRVLSGEANFSGRLTVSMPRSVGQLPLYYNHLTTGRPQVKVDDHFVSKYVDEQNSPLYPFGHGLSYARFEYSKPTLDRLSHSAAKLNTGVESLTVAAQIRNTGARDGVEIVQLYVALRGTSVARPVRELKGFQRLPLRAGEAREVAFKLGKDELAFWNIDMKHVVEPAAVTVWVTKDAQSGEPAELLIAD